MVANKRYDVIIVGGSYSGLAAGMALGRASITVLIIDGGKPCNRQTPHSHNFLTQDGSTPAQIAGLAKQQVEKYSTVQFLSSSVVNANKHEKYFEVEVASGEKFEAEKLVFATGIKDIMQDIPGYAECWGISLLHCPYCHGYEVKDQPTGILGNGDQAFELAILISNWTNDLTVYTNGKSALTDLQAESLAAHNIRIVEKAVQELAHVAGKLESVRFTDGTRNTLKAIYTKSAFEQHCYLPESLGCELTTEGYIKVDSYQETTVKGVFACGDNVTRMRTVANAVAMGTAVGMTVSKRLIFEDFEVNAH